MVPHLDAEHALFLLALPDDDADKQTALAHAGQCPSCQLLLDEAKPLLALLDAAGTRDLADAQQATDATLQARVRAAVYGEARAKRTTWPRPRSGVLIGLGALVSALLVWLQATPARPLQAAIGVRCFLFEQEFAAVALGLGLFGWRYLAQLGAGAGALLAMTGALAGQALLLQRCEAQGAAVHLLLFHGLGVLIATLAGAGVGRWRAKRA